MKVKSQTPAVPNFFLYVQAASNSAFLVNSAPVVGLKVDPCMYIYIYV